MIVLAVELIIYFLMVVFDIWLISNMQDITWVDYLIIVVLLVIFATLINI